MTQEEKELLLRDLCARLPYGVKIYLEDFPNATLVGVVNEGIILHCDKYKHVYDTPWNIEYIKPYLFPLSSMTKEQRKEFNNISRESIKKHMEGYSKEEDFQPRLFHAVVEITRKQDDWLNRNHFDSLGLIEMGLAKDVTGLNIY